jgi:tetratricopeptide (TPR) repeat protein
MKGMIIVVALGLIGCGLAPGVASGPDTAELATQAVLEGNWAALAAQSETVEKAFSKPVADLLLGYSAIVSRDYCGAWRRFSAVDNSGQYQVLLRWTREVQERHPQAAIAWLLAGDALARAGRYDDSVRALDRAVELDPQMALCYDLRGLVKIIAGRLPEAKADLSKAVEPAPQSPNAQFDLAMLTLITGQLEEATSRMSRLLEEEPEFFLARNGRGVAYLLQGKYDLALQDFDKVSRECPDFADAQENKTAAGLIRARGLFAVDLKRVAELSAKGILGSQGSILLAVGTGRASTDRAAAVAAQTLSKLTGDLGSIITTNPAEAIGTAARGRSVVLALDSTDKSYNLTGIMRAINAGRIETHLIPDGRQATLGVTQIMGDLYREAKGVTGAIKGIHAIDPPAIRGPRSLLPPGMLPGAGTGGLGPLAAAVRRVDPNVLVDWNLVGGKLGTNPNLRGDVKIGRDLARQLPNFRLNETPNKYTLTPSVGLSINPATGQVGLGASVGIGGTQTEVGTGLLEARGMFHSYSGGRLDMRYGSIGDILAGQLASGPGARGMRQTLPSPMTRVPEPPGKGVYLRLGPPQMDVQTETNTDLSFLQGQKAPVAADTTGREDEADFTYPFLILNAFSGAAEPGESR